MRITGERVTLQHIAAAAGVSVSTVSRALSGDEDIAHDTRRRIQELGRRHGYRRPPRDGRPVALIDLVLSDLSSPWTMDVIRGVERAAHQHGSGVVVSHARGRADRRLAARLRSGSTDGVIVDAPQLADMVAGTSRAAVPPVVVLDPCGSAGTSLATVTVTAWTGGVQATDFLLAQGHRRIGAIAGPRHLLASLAPLSGYRTALETAGLTLREELLRWGDLTAESGLLEADHLLDLPHPPTAILACGDYMALGVVEAVRRRGLGVPGDISVIGLGDVPAARASSPPLTTIRQPYAEMGGIAVRMIADLVRGAESDTLLVELGGHLVVRASTAAPPR